MKNKKWLDSLLAERELLLAENPELRRLQEEIDSILDELNAAPEDRAEIAFTLMIEFFKSEFIPNLVDLNDLRTIIQFKLGQKNRAS